MTIAIADLVARVRSEGVQETQAAVKAVGAEAAQTARALELMAAQFAKLHGGTAADALTMFQKSGVQPTAAALAEVAAAAEKASAAIAQTAATAKASASSIAAALSGAGVNASGAQIQSILTAQSRADQQSSLAKALEGAGVAAGVARQQAKALTGETQAAAKAAEDLGRGFDLSTGTLIRGLGALTGVGLGLSAVVGIASQLHQVVVGIVQGQLDWERSLQNLSGLYGETGARAAALANAQASLPGVLGTQQEFAQAGINASDLRLRYGLPQRLIDQLTTTGGRVAFAAGLTNEAERTQLQQQIAQAVRTGAALPTQYGVYTDEEAVSRRLGFGAPQALQAFTPQQLMEARGAIVSEGLNTFADRANANQRAALAVATSAEKALEQARTNAQTALERAGTVTPGYESRGGGFGSGPAFQLFSTPREIGAPARTAFEGQSSAQQRSQEAAALQTYLDNQEQVAQAATIEAQALANSAKAQEEARKTIETLGRGAERAGAQLLNFFGALTDTTSIAHGDLLAQAQGAVSARARSAMPMYAIGAAEVSAIATGNAAQAAWQNYVARLAQEPQANAIRANLERLAATEGPGLEASRSSAASALVDQRRREGPVGAALVNAEKADALEQLRLAEAQSNVEEINLRYRERGLTIERDTIGLRKTEAQISLENVTLTERVLKAQQAALPSGIALQNLSFEQQRTALLAQERQAGLLRGEDVSGLPSFDELIGRNVSLALSAPGVARRALEAGHEVDVAGQAATAGGIRAGLAQVPITRSSLQLALEQYGDDPARLAAELGLTSAQGRALVSGRNVRTATGALANVSLTLSADGTVRLADDAIKAAADQARDLVEQALREGLSESDQSAPPASSQLAGARR